MVQKLTLTQNVALQPDSFAYALVLTYAAARDTVDLPRTIAAMESSRACVPREFAAPFRFMAGYRADGSGLTDRFDDNAQVVRGLALAVSSGNWLRKLLASR